MSNKRFLFVSWDSLIGDIAWQTVKEGHEVKYYIQNPDEREIADGFVPKTDDWRQEVDWADVVVFDDVLGMGSLAEELRRNGKLGRVHKIMLRVRNCWLLSTARGVEHGSFVLPYGRAI
jgi:phosphoribosylamine--glycine ligase